MPRLKVDLDDVRETPKELELAFEGVADVTWELMSLFDAYANIWDRSPDELDASVTTAK